MKVKELITKLLECDPELDVAYEHCSVDYCEQHDQENLVEMGDLRPFPYTRWIPFANRMPEDNDLPCLIASKENDGNWRYVLITEIYKGLEAEAKRGTMWMSVERTLEDKYRRIGYDDEIVQKLLARKTNG